MNRLLGISSDVFVVSKWERLAAGSHEIVGGVVRILVPATFDDIEEAKGIIFVVFSIKFSLVNLNFSFDVVFWQMDIVLIGDPRKVCIVVWLVVGVCIGGICITVAVFMFSIKAASRISVVVRK